MPEELSTVTPTIAPCPSRPGISEGHGEGVEFQGKHYYYIVGKPIPKDKVVIVKWEGCFCGRVNGDVEWLVLAYNQTNFTILDHHWAVGIKEVLAKYKGLSVGEAIEKKTAELRKWQAHYDALPKCKCGNVILLLDDDQSEDTCSDCFRASRSEPLLN